MKDESSKMKVKVFCRLIDVGIITISLSELRAKRLNDYRLATGQVAKSASENKRLDNSLQMNNLSHLFTAIFRVPFNAIGWVAGGGTRL